MKKVLVLALSLTLGGFAAHAQTATTAPAQEKVAGPLIQFEEMKYDFGVIKQGDIVDHTFKFKNTGTAPLIISNIRVSCGCTTPSWTKNAVAPGATGEMEVQFDSRGKQGLISKQVNVRANTQPSITTIYIKGNVLTK